MLNARLASRPACGQRRSLLIAPLDASSARRHQLVGRDPDAVQQSSSTWTLRPRPAVNGDTISRAWRWHRASTRRPRCGAASSRLAPTRPPRPPPPRRAAGTEARPPRCICASWGDARRRSYLPATPRWGADPSRQAHRLKGPQQRVVRARARGEGLPRTPCGPPDRSRVLAPVPRPGRCRGRAGL